MLKHHIYLKTSFLGKCSMAFLALFCSFRIAAQQELMLHALPDVWHSTSTNPAFFPEGKKFILGLPGIGLDGAHSGDVSYRDVFVKDGDRTVLDFSKVISKLDFTNEARFDQRTEIVNLGIRLPGKIMLQAGYANRLSGMLVYPKALPELLWLGNGPFVGQTLNIGLKMDVADWNEWSVGLARQFGPLSVGLRGKLLTGVSALMTDPAHIAASVYTSPDIYQLSLHTDFGFYSASIIEAIDTSNLGFDLRLADLKRKAFSKNTGTALDIGLKYQVNERITLDASILDLGASIKWDTKANHFLSQGDYTYDGQTFPGSDIINGIDSLGFDLALDTLNDIFKFNKTPTEFTTKLPLRGYFGGSYKFSKRWVFGLSAYFTHREDAKNTFAMGGSARWTPMKWLSVGAMYSVNRRSAANLGLQVVVKPGPVQLYFASDNLLNAFSVKNSPAVNLRAGIALML
jgi:Family of unknown function (DUF5723)